MATGSYDSNGIWHNGEDDNIALFSDTLNKLAVYTSSGLTSDRSRISTLEAGSLSGLIPISPVSITPVTGTAAINSIGLITVSGITKLEVNGIFTANYNKYKIIHSLIGSTGSGVTLQFRRSNVDIATGYYGGGLYSNYVGTLANTAANNATSGTFSQVSTSRVALGHVELDMRVAVSPTYIYSHYGAAVRTYYSGGIGNDLSGGAADGFTLTVATGNVTGTIQIFGYND